MIFPSRSAPRLWLRAALGLCVVLASAGPALALLSPWWQRSREIGAIAADPRVAAALEKDGPIVAISVAGDDRYSVTTAHCRLEVVVVAHRPDPNAPVGPKQFSLKLGSPVCR